LGAYQIWQSPERLSLHKDEIVDPFFLFETSDKTVLICNKDAYETQSFSGGDSSKEMATIGHLSPVHPDLLLAIIQTELKTKIKCTSA
jgi:hypothetical protein